MHKYQKGRLPITDSACDYAREAILSGISLKIGSLFLIMPYDAKYSKLEKAIKKFFKDKYTVHLAKDYMQDILGCICEKIKEADFGIVVLARLKYREKGRDRIRMNIPFEYGMFKILDKPVMLVCESKLNIDINKEFSDIRNENYGEKITLGRQITQIEKRIGQIFDKFIPELAKKTAQRTLDELAKEYPSLPYSKKGIILRNFRTQYEIQIRKEFEDKIRHKKEK